MTRVLFVDDEPNVLDGLRDGLRRQRHVWEMAFVGGAAEALHAMAAKPYDVVVTDIRMPGVDGAELLRVFQRDYPSTIRLVLSGQADRDLVLQLLPLAQQFLSKPCRAPDVQAAISRAIALREMLGDAATLALTGSVGSLPSAPATYVRLTDALASGRAVLSDLARIVERDAALSAKVLQVVNSAYFGMAQPVVSVAPALNYLGEDSLRALALSVGIFGDARAAKLPPEYSVDAAMMKGLQVAQLARAIVLDRGRRDEAFTCGVLHGVGQLLLATRLTERYGAVLREANDSDRALVEVEMLRLGTSYPRVGAALLAAWGLPAAIVQCLAFHQPLHSPAPTADVVTIAVHVASALVADLLHGQAAQYPLDVEALETMNVARHLDQWRADAEHLMETGA